MFCPNATIRDTRKATQNTQKMKKEKGKSNARPAAEAMTEAGFHDTVRFPYRDHENMSGRCYICATQKRGDTGENVTE
jgi:hypothetical protein